MAKGGELLIRGADVVVIMDASRRELPGADILMPDGVIAGVRYNLRGQAANAGVIGAHGCVVTPGLVNNHLPSVSDPDPGGAGGAGCAAVWLAQGAVPDLVPVWPRRNLCFGANRPCRTGAQRLFYQFGSPVSVRQWGPAGSYHRRRPQGRVALSPNTRRNVDR